MFHGSKNLFPGIPGCERKPGFRVRAFKHTQYVQILTAMKQVFGPRKQVLGPENHSWKMSNLLHGPESSNQILPREKRVNRDIFSA